MLADTIPLLIIGSLSLVAVSIAAMWFQQRAFNQAFEHFRDLVTPGVVEMQEAAKKEAEALVSAFSEDAKEEDAGLSPYEHLSPLARPYMAGYDYGLNRSDDGDGPDEVVAEVEAAVASHWAKEFSKERAA